MLSVHAVGQREPVACRGVASSLSVLYLVVVSWIKAGRGFLICEVREAFLIILAIETESKRRPRDRTSQVDIEVDIFGRTA